MKLRNGREFTPELQTIYTRQAYREAVRQDPKTQRFSHSEWFYDVGRARYLITTITGQQIRGAVLLEQ